VCYPLSERAFVGFKNVLSSKHPAVLSCSEQYISMLEDIERQRIPNFKKKYKVLIKLYAFENSALSAILVGKWVVD
jgi:hypothetical protein